MKAVSSVLLLYGHEVGQLETRKWVLQTRGYQVVQISQVDEVKRVPLEPRAELLIVCQPVGEAELNAVTALAERRWPGLKRLVLGQADSRYPTGMLGGLMYTMDGPGKLLNLVKDLVGGTAGAGEPEAS